MWVRLDDQHVKALKRLEVSGSKRHQAALRSLLKRIAKLEAEAKDPVLRKYVDGADELHGREGEIEFDGDAVVSKGKDAGAYVMGWVWVYDSDVGIGEEEDEDDEEEG